ncbi:MAG: 2Fe-2S iron-sulfur cluster binding domain-containing protein [Clostridiales Family XIII bacterium]|jgi:ferredoxin|nr:2Fe-2S iron-sulfur cluster binding domain-containing protein [Clostridiales Family XIII bacterium]
MAPVYEIRITDGRVEKYHFACRGDEPLLNGIRRTLCTEIPRGCSGGGCGICKVVIRRGEAAAFKPMSREHITREELAENVMLACCVNPRSDMEIAFYCPGEAAIRSLARVQSAQTNGSIAVGA